MLTRIPPYSQDAEQATIGCVLYKESNYEEATAQGLTSEDFYVPANRLIWQRLCDMAANGLPIDGLTVADYMDADALDMAGGRVYLEQCIDLATIPSDIMRYAATVQTKAKGRLIIDAAREAENAMYEEGADPDTISSQLELSIHKIGEGGSEKRGKRSIIDAYDNQVEMYKTNTDGIALRTGIEYLDKGFGGMMKGLSTAISGPPGTCKTTIMREAVKYMALAGGHRGAIKSLEQTTEQLTGSIAASMTGASVWRLNTGCHGDDEAHKKEITRFEQARGQIIRLSTLLDIDDSRATMPEVWAWARRAIADGAEFLVLDHIGKIQDCPADKGKRHDIIVGSRIVQIADIAKEFDVPFIVISPESNEGKLKNSGDIEYEVGHWLQMGHFDPDNRKLGKYTATIKKSRFGRVLGPETLCWYKDTLIPESEYLERTSRDVMAK